MPKSANQKKKLLYISKMLMEKTDREHPMTVNQIISELAHYDIQAERKTIYSDIQTLIDFGMDIMAVKSRSTGYYIDSRDFDYHELHLLADAVASARFITEKKSDILIKKLSSLCNQHKGALLKRTVKVKDRIKTDNETIFYSVDAVNRAISRKAAITFRYFDYDLKNQKAYRHDGSQYKVTPYGLYWDNEYYYVIGWYEANHKVSHFRVDRMEGVQIDDAAYVAPPERFDLNSYTKSIFNMFAGEMKRVWMRFETPLLNPVYDRFGKNNLQVVPDGDQHFVFSADVTVSPSFFSWVFQFGDKARITAPPEVKGAYADHVRRVYENL